MNKDFKMKEVLAFYVYTLAIVICSLKISTSEAFTHCPNYCKCDLYEGRNRADCTGQRLINPYVEISTAVEVLDLSYNDIAIIDDDCFEHYHYLINLTITHNDVHTIYLDAFLKLRRLSAVDLAYNRLDYLDERLFEANRHLQVLNLEGNRFTKLQSRPFLRSISLRTLNLRNAGINYIGLEMFTALPQLTELDLSQNLMITFNAATFNAVKHLKSLLLDENPWICDKSIVKALSIIRHRGINASMPECEAAYHEWQKQLPLRVDGKNSNASHGQNRMFERMRLMDSENVKSEITNNNSSHNIDNSGDGVDDKTLENTKVLNWRNLSNENENNDDLVNYDNRGDDGNKIDDTGSNNDVSNNHSTDDDDDDDNDILDFANFIGDKQISKTRLSLLGIKVDETLCDGPREHLCSRYRNCLEQVSHHLIKQLQNNDETYTETDMFLAFIFGNVVGIAFVVFVFTCVLLVKVCCSKLRRSKQQHDIERVYETLPYAAHPANNRNENVLAATVTATEPVTLFPTRRSRRPRRQPVRVPIEHAIVHHDREHGADNFISRLLGRPARRQYYRATATLIRSLSRTSLFNGNTQRDQNSSTRTPQSDLTTPTSETSPLNHNRPETPPPKYGDIISKK